MAAEGHLLQCENSAMPTHSLGDWLCGFLLQVAPREAENGGQGNHCLYLIGGKTPSNPLSPRESKTRHSNSSSWLMTTSGLSKEWNAFLD